MPAEVTWHCACDQCACIARVLVPRAVCSNCASGEHHNMVNK